MRTAILALCLVLFAGISAGASEEFPTDIALLRQLKIAPPGPYVPAKTAAFSGKWEGFNYAGRGQILIVEYVLSSGNASVVYGVANMESTEKVKPYRYIYRYKAQIRDGVLKFKTIKGYLYTFALISGELHMKVFGESGIEYKADAAVLTRGEPVYPSPAFRGIYANEEAKLVCEQYIPAPFFEINFFDSAPGRSAATALLVYQFLPGTVQLRQGRCEALSLLSYTSGNGSKAPDAVGELWPEVGDGVRG